ncbi:hypothetical protein E3N88_41901 [Mikania micrantha]|uniref:Protein kinase domain-containing protein n=1 Tax=Mikania micrantha TaxID=192012 RepID=A0A5N6LLI8_9ASTR|nr:hypothetical protein E3N88_41901 [Mikania micrantha]
MREIRVYIAVGVVAFGICILVVASAFYVIVCIKRKKMKENYSSCNKSVNLELQQLNLSVRTTSEKKVSFESQIESLDGHVLPTTPGKTASGLVESYTVKELSIATDEFSSTNLIEGSVYHGRLKEKMWRSNSQILFLVFEYAENGSLKDWLHGGLAMKSQFIASCSCFLTWNQRLKICLHVATALQYMHQIINPSYIHRNIKSRNIFLDKEFHAKVGNFGMDTCIQDENHPKEVYSSGNLSSSFPIAWDKGYIAPEHSNSDAFSPSIDIYAYGVVLLEILSGKPPIGRTKSENNDEIRLSDEIKAILASGKVEDKLREWMDTTLGENYSFDVAVVLANLASACVEGNPLRRPNAGEVVVKLSELVAEREEQVIIQDSSCRPLVA